MHNTRKPHHNNIYLKPAHPYVKSMSALDITPKYTLSVP